MMHDWYDNGWGAGSWIAMGLMMLAFWGLITVLVIYAIRSLGHHQSDQTGAPSAPADRALGLLDERFARGEIDADEYHQRRDLLRSP